MTVSNVFYYTKNETHKHCSKTNLYVDPSFSLIPRIYSGEKKESRSVALPEE